MYNCNFQKIKCTPNRPSKIKTLILINRFLIPPKISTEGRGGEKSVLPVKL